MAVDKDANKLGADLVLPYELDIIIPVISPKTKDGGQLMK